MVRRRNKSFRPYRIQRDEPRIDIFQERIPRKKEEVIPYEPPEYYVGDIIHCLDKTTRSVTKVTYRGGVWIVYWILIEGKGEGLSTEYFLKKIDVFKKQR